MKMFNAEAVKTDTKDFTPLPDGQYLTECLKATFLRKRDGVLVSDKTLDLEFVVLSGDRKKSRIWTSQTIDTERMALYPNSQVILAGLLKSAGSTQVDLECPESKWAEYLVGKIYSLKVTTKDDKNGYPRTYIQAVRTLTPEEKALGALVDDKRKAEADDSDLPF